MRLPRRKGPAGPVHAVRRTGQPGPRFNYELFNCNNFNIRYWSWNYRGCWHQTCPPIVPRYTVTLGLSSGGWAIPEITSHVTHPYLVSEPEFRASNSSSMLEVLEERGCCRLKRLIQSPNSKGFKLYSFQLRNPNELRISIYCHYLPASGLGNLRACCLPWMW